MTVSNKPFNMSYQHPFMMYSYIEDGCKRVALDFLVPPMAQKNFISKVTSGGMEVQLTTIVPKFFVSCNRLMLAKVLDEDFNEDTHRATSFEEASDKLTKSFGIEDLDDEDDVLNQIVGEPQRVKMPFKVEDDIEWGVQAFVNDDPMLTHDCNNNEQMFFVVSIELVSVEKRKEKKKGTFNVIGSPNKKATKKKGRKKNEDEDDDDDEEGMNTE
jgi:hypothetical protein